MMFIRFSEGCCFKSHIRIYLIESEISIANKEEDLLSVNFETSNPIN